MLVVSDEVRPVAAVNRPDALSMVPAALLDDAQTAELVMSCWVPPGKVAVAVNCSVTPWPMLESGDVTVIF